MKWLGLLILARNLKVPVFRSTRLSVKSTTPWCGKTGLPSGVFLVGEADQDRHFLLRLRLQLPLLEQAADPQHRLLVDVEVDVERVLAHDGGHHRLVGLDQVAGIDHAAAEPAGEPLGQIGRDLGPVEVELRQVKFALAVLRAASASA